MHRKISFPSAEYMTLGRNGYTKSCGIEVSQIGQEVFLEPVNSKGDIGRARLVVPMSHVRELRDALSAMLGEGEYATLGECEAPAPESVLVAIASAEEDGEALPDAVEAAWAE